MNEQELRASGAVQGHKPNCPHLAYAGYRCTCVEPPTEMTSLLQIKERLAAIESNQTLDRAEFTKKLDYLIAADDVLAERLDAILKLGTDGGQLYGQIAQKLDEIRGALLLQQFKGGRRCPAKSRTKKRK